MTNIWKFLFIGIHFLFCQIILLLISSVLLVTLLHEIFSWKHNHCDKISQLSKSIKES